MSPEQVREVLPTFDRFHPLGRNGQPAEVVEAILYLASDRASWITGAILLIDGGAILTSAISKSSNFNSWIRDILFWKKI